MLSNDTPGTTSFVIDSIQVIEIDLVCTVLGLDGFCELLEFEVVIQRNYIAFYRLEYAAPGFFACLCLFLIGALPQDFDAIKLLLEPLVHICRVFVQIV